MKPDLKAIKERCDAATPGPWLIKNFSIFNDANAKFCVEARKDIPALLAYIERLEKVAEAARAAIEHALIKDAVENPLLGNVGGSLWTLFRELQKALRELEGEG